MPGARSAVVFALPLDQSLIPGFLGKVDRRSFERNYETVNSIASGVAVKLSNFMTQKGHPAVPLAANDVYREDVPLGRFAMLPPLSLRYLAVAAGVGSFGLSGNVITDESGAAVILGALVTTAELTPTASLDEDDNYCDGCRLCLATCASGLMDPENKTTVTLGDRIFSYAARRCDKEVMTCIHFDDMADYFVQYQNGRYLSQEECKNLIEENVRGGLVTTLANYQDIFYGYCLCDPCCCVLLRPLVEENNYHSIERSNFRPRFDFAKCTRCQKCRAACPVRAIGKLPAAWGKPKKEDKMFLFEDRCIGCGVCVAQCEFDALKLYRVDDKAPEKTPRDAVMRHVAERMI